MSNKTSDKNVENIEIVIKDCREHLKLYREAFITADELDIIENILAEREQDKKRIKELEEENAKYKSLDYMFKIQNEENYVDMKKIYFEWLDSIPKQIVIDKIEENIGYLEYADIMYEYTQKDVIEECIKTLQELLGTK